MNTANNIIHITSGDTSGKILEETGLAGEILVWHDILYNVPRCIGWPDQDTLNARAVFLENETGGGLDRKFVLETLVHQYDKLAQAASGHQIILWFDACLFDQAMLAHILACLQLKSADQVALIVVDTFPGIEPFHGLGQLTPEQLRSFYKKQKPVTRVQFEFAAQVDNAFATQDISAFTALSKITDAPLPWIPAAVARWLEEQEDPVTGLGKLERFALTAICNGCKTPRDIFLSVAKADTPPQYWGDTTLWAKINRLADRNPPLVKISGPQDRLPQWESKVSFNEFRITPLHHTR